MTFTPKTWGNDAAGGTPLNAAAMVDLETRVTAYGDSIRLMGGAVDATQPPYNAPENTGAAGAAIQSALTSFATVGHKIGGAVYLPTGTYNLERPLIIPDNVKLIGMGGRGATSLFATSAFPSMTLNNGGTLTLPASTITMTTMSPNMPTTGGVITMLSSNGIQKVLYTGISGNNFTGCTQGTGTVTDGAVVGTFAIWLGDPIAATTGAYGARIESLYIDLSPTGASSGARPGGSGLFTNRAQEESGARDVLFRNYMHRGMCINAIVPSGQVTQNMMFRGLTLQASSTSDANLVSCEYNGAGATCRGMDDVTFVSVGLIAVPGVALSLIGASGVYSRFNVEQHATGILVDNATSSNRGLVLEGIIGFGAALVDLIKITSSPNNNSVAMLGIEKLSAPSANLINDLTSGDSIVCTDNSVACYIMGQPNAQGLRSVISDSATIPNRIIPGVAAAVVTVTYSAAITFDTSTGDYFKISATDTNAFTIGAPANPTRGANCIVDITNSSGGVMGAITWNAIFKLAGAFTNPASTKRRIITFYHDGSNWVELSRGAADI